MRELSKQWNYSIVLSFSGKWFIKWRSIPGRSKMAVSCCLCQVSRSYSLAARFMAPNHSAHYHKMSSKNWIRLWWAWLEGASADNKESSSESDLVPLLNRISLEEYVSFDNDVLTVSDGKCPEQRSQSGRKWSLHCHSKRRRHRNFSNHRFKDCLCVCRQTDEIFA